MSRMKKRIFYGTVCEQEVYSVSDRARSRDRKKPRFETEEDRARHREHVAWTHYYRSFMATFNCNSLYSTLTFDRDHEILTGWEAELVKNTFVRALRRLNPDAQIDLHIGVGDRGRIHYHMVSNGLTKEQILSKWHWGEISRIENLYKTCKDENGEDIGADYVGLCTYLFNHRCPDKLSGRRYFATRNWNKPDEEEPTETVREYSLDKPPLAPKGYKLVSATATPYGYLSFKYVQIVPQAKPNPRRNI